MNRVMNGVIVIVLILLFIWVTWGEAMYRISIGDYH